MALMLNIEDLLNKQKIESNRIEFKKGWNPVTLYHSIYAFANDFDDLGGGYILVGVDTDENGVAKRPVAGIPEEQIDDILQDMIGYNAKFGPSENRMLKNVAAMMFCEQPDKLFKYMQVDVVVFPDGKIQNPSNFRERTFKGSVPQIVQQTMTFFKTEILYETVQKVSGQADFPYHNPYP